MGSSPWRLLLGAAGGPVFFYAGLMGSSLSRPLLGVAGAVAAADLLAAGAMAVANRASTAPLRYAALGLVLAALPAIAAQAARRAGR